jgi:hypothetical protein
MTSLVSGRGTLAIAPSGFGNPLEVRQLISASFSLIYYSFRKSKPYDSEIWLSFIKLILNKTVLVPVGYARIVRKHKNAYR